MQGEEVYRYVSNEYTYSYYYADYLGAYEEDSPNNYLENESYYKTFNTDGIGCYGRDYGSKSCFEYSENYDGDIPSYYYSWWNCTAECGEYQLYYNDYTGSWYEQTPF